MQFVSDESQLLFTEHKNYIFTFSLFSPCIPAHIYAPSFFLPSYGRSQVWVMEIALAGFCHFRLAFSWVLFACNLTLLVLLCEDVGIAEVSCLP